MTETLASPVGITLPYSSIFNVNLRQQSNRPLKSRPSHYFWKRANQTPVSPATPEDHNQTPNAEPDNISRVNSSPVLTDSEADLSPNPINPGVTRQRYWRPKLRKIAFKAFTPKSHDTSQKNNIVRTTEILPRHQDLNPLQHNGSSNSRRNPCFSIFRSWKLKSKSGGTQVKNLIAVVKHRISASSPLEKKPKTWEEYRDLYANEQIDIQNPPLPPIEPFKDVDDPSALQPKFFSAPKPPNQPVRQLVLNRLGIFGKKGFQLTDEAAAASKARTKLGDQLMQLGKSPASLDTPWEYVNSLTSSTSEQNLLIKNPNLPPETLEQHPVFRNIVRKCRELFHVSISILSILDDERQIFLAESGLDIAPQYEGLREIPRDMTVCAHTVLSSRKGLTVLDLQKDWRFQNNPLLKSMGCRFYAGVPLMAPNLDGSQEAEDNSCPLGTLCLIDWEPRESFNSEDRKKLVYLSEYARREIEKWFVKKMECKMENLITSQEIWKQELNRIESDPIDLALSPQSEVLSDTPQNNHATERSPKTFRALRSVSSMANELSSQSSHASLSIKSPKKKSPSIFEDIDLALKPNMRRVFDLATKLVSETLDLSLVYLAAAVPYDESSLLGRTQVISGHNIPTPPPVFDTGLHLKALRTPEGGLLYQNPSVEESEKDGLQPKSPHSDDVRSHSNVYASAMLLAVSSEAQHNAGGFILAGYTEDPKRVLGAEDVTYMKQFARELSRYTSKLQL